jgi:hypothetical protein
MVVEVAKAVHVNRNIKAIPNNSPCLFILTNSLEMDVHILNLAKLYIKEKKRKTYINPMLYNLNRWRIYRL